MTRIVLTVLALLLTAVAARGGAPQPNAIVVLADDLGRGDLAAWGGVTPTPNLDRMAREGVRFERYYAPSPICSPSRCGLLTGQYPGRHRITSYLQTRAGNRACEQADFLAAAAPTLPRVLKGAGYRTAHVGKWHLGGGRDVRDAPRFTAYGYDTGLGTWESPEPHPDITARDWIWSAADPVKRWDRSRWMVDRTLDFVRADAARPAFVTLWLDDPHTPWVPTADDQTVGADGRASGKGPTPARLAGVLAEMDRQVGRLLDGVRAAGGARPTLVLFLSDNGPLPTFMARRSAGLRGSKLSLYEGGIRVPGLAWGPGLVAAGVVNDATVLSGVDLLPSLARLCGAPLPAGYSSDGEDLSEAFRGRAPRRSRPLYWEYGRNPSSFAYPMGRDRSPQIGYREADWKLLVNADGTGAELYDLAADPNETTDRAAAEPDRVRTLQTRALALRREWP